MTSPSPTPAAPPLRRLLLTGAAGTLGRALAAPLRTVCDTLVRSDRPAPLATLGDPSALPCELADAAAVHRLLEGVDAVVHLGGVSVEGPWEPILQANIRGLHHLYEAARRQGTRRIVFASSNHVTGCYEQGRLTRPGDPPRPDGNYGLSKLFGEGIASLYWDRWGVESVCLRIGTATPAPPDLRGLSTWISLRDLAELVRCALTAPGVGFLVASGMSGNTRGWWNSTESWSRLGFVPRDNAEDHAAQVQQRLLPEGPQRRLQGGSFLGLGPYDLPVG